MKNLIEVIAEFIGGGELANELTIHLENSGYVIIPVDEWKELHDSLADTDGEIDTLHDVIRDLERELEDAHGENAELLGLSRSVRL